MDDFDLTGRILDVEDAPSKTSSKRSKSDSKGSSTKKSKRKSDTVDVHGRIESLIDRMIEWRQNRGDDEMAEVLREESEPLVRGIEVVCVKFGLVGILVVAVMTFIEPLLAIWRIGTLTLIRIGEWRLSRQTQATNEN